MNNEKKDVQTRQLHLLRIQTILIACLLVIIVIVGVVLTAQFKSIQDCIDLLNTDVLNEAVTAFTDAANQFNKLDIDAFNKTVAALESAADQLKGIDIENLNSLVAALEDVATKLQNTVDAITGFWVR